jgi:hypothetical protein
MKFFNLIIKIFLSLLLVSPILGAFGVFPAPTSDMYNTELAFRFISVLTEIQYINWIMAIVNIFVLFFIWTKREALAGILLAPITLNIVSFHAFIDSGLFTAGAIMANILFLINIYLIWKNFDVYKVLLKK